MNDWHVWKASQSVISTSNYNTPSIKIIDPLKSRVTISWITALYFVIALQENFFQKKKKQERTKLVKELYLDKEISLKERVW